MKQATLCLLIRENRGGKELLLAMKKRGFGIGKWNGVGGKFDSEKGDRNIIDTVIRETEEEISVKVKDFEKTAHLSFYFPYQEEWNQNVHVFLAKNWEGEPKESEEMDPKWFKIGDIPFEEMWDDDRFWLPHILEGRKVKAKFIFKEGEKISEKKIKIVNNLG